LSKTHLGDRALQHFVYHFGELFYREWLLKSWLITVAVRDADRAVPGGKNKRTPIFFDDVGHWRNHLPIEVHIEDGKIKLYRLDELDGLANLTRFACYGVAKLFEHVGHHHSDHYFVFDE